MIKLNIKDGKSPNLGDAFNISKKRQEEIKESLAMNAANAANDDSDYSFSKSILIKKLLENIELNSNEEVAFIFYALEALVQTIFSRKALKKMIGGEKRGGGGDGDIPSLSDLMKNI